MTWFELEKIIKNMSDKNKEIVLVIVDQPGHPIVGSEVTFEEDCLKAWEQK